jgi:hypothetical protein
VYTHTHKYIYSDRENKIALTIISEGAVGDGRKKENVKELKILK